MDHKNIDNLFKKQLENLEVSPKERVWSNIETQLKKKKRKVFPFWWFSGAAAAILVLGMFLYPFLQDENQNINKNSDEIITTIPEKKPYIQNKIDSIFIDTKSDENILITEKETPLKKQKKDKNTLVDDNKELFFHPKKRVESLLLSYKNVDINFTSIQQKLLINNLRLEHIKVTKKLDLNDFSAPKKPLKNEKSKIKNWSIAPTFAVLKSNSFTNTSPINANLANSTNGENSYSYGVQIAYKLNKKWTIQSGIHLQEMSYSNNQIAVNASSQSNPFSTAFVSGDAFSFNSDTSDNITLSNSFSSSNPITSTANLAQNFGYIEIPLELKYNFLNNKNFETQLVTGFSSLFLNKNEVNLSTENSSRSLEAGNLNNINFSGNLGFDFNYLFNKNWSLNLNPMLKVQLNTFNENANGFAPFNLGVYSGIKYQF